MSAGTKHILKEVAFWVLVPTAIAVGIKGVQFGMRRMKEKNLLDALRNHLVKGRKDVDKALTDSDKKVVEDWKNELRKLKSNSFYAFTDYALATELGGKDKDGKYIFEVSNPDEFAKIKSEFERKSEEIKRGKLPEYLKAINK